MIQKDSETFRIIQKDSELFQKSLSYSEIVDTYYEWYLSDDLLTIKEISFAI